MSTHVQIDQMSVAEKLSLMEQLWEDLRARAEGVPMPQWHKDTLDERQFGYRRLRNPSARFAATLREERRI